LVPVLGQLDLPDALALDTALTVGAQALKDAGSDAPLETRRSWALGDLARAATGHGTLFDGVAFDGAASPQPGGECTLATGTWVPAGPAGATPPATPPSRPHWNGKGASPPNVKLFIHLPSSTFFTPGT